MTRLDYALLPNFLTIGASKAGTTSLHDVLSRHPHIFCTQVKEPGFFSAQARYDHGLAWYQDTFFSRAGGYPARGESSGAYLHWSSHTAARIQSAYQGHDLKFIVILRDPVARAYSYYRMQVRNDNEPLTFEEALAHEEERLALHQQELARVGQNLYGYYRGGCYATLLEPFLERFPRASFAFPLLEDLASNFTATTSTLARFLGVDDTFAFQPLRSNASTAFRSSSLNRFLNRPSGLIHLLIKTFTHQMSFTARHQVKKAVIRANQRRQSYPAIDPLTAASLRTRYLPEIERLEALIGRDLSAWKTG